MKIYKINIPDKNLWRLLIYAGVIVFFIGAGIIPLTRHNANLNKDIKKLQDQIAEQKNLKPLYEMLLKNMEKKTP